MSKNKNSVISENLREEIAKELGYKISEIQMVF